MRIVIDMQGAQTPFSGHRGVGRHTKGIVKGILQHAKQHEIILALNGAFPETIEPLRTEFNGLISQGNIRVWQQFFSTAASDLSNSSRGIIGKKLREEFLNSLKADVVYSTNLQEGLFDNACTSIPTIREKTLYFSTLHDVAPLRHVDKYLLDGNIKQWYDEKLKFARESDVIFTVSEFSKEEIHSLLDISESKIRITYGAFDDDTFKNINITSNDKHNIQKKFSITKPFLLYTGGGDFHKNLKNLFIAFSRLSAEIITKHQLVIVGKEHKYNDDHAPILKELGIEDDIIFTGYVNDLELVSLLNICKLFVLPSTYEGFGLPLLEAMACGAAVVASNAASLPEVIGHMPEAMFDPYDVNHMSQRISAMLSNEKLLESVKTHSKKQVEKFSWKNSALSALSAFEEFHDNKKIITSAKVEHPTQKISNFIRQNRQHLSLNTTDLRSLAISIAETFSDETNFDRPMIYLDVSCIAINDDRTGIQRVTRALSCELLKLTNFVVPVWTTPDKSEFFTANKLIKDYMGTFSEEVRREKESLLSRILEREWIDFRPGDVLVYLDLHPSVATSHVRKNRYLMNKGINVYHVVYDILPELLPEFFSDEICREFQAWLSAISQSNGAICISKAVLEELSFWKRNNLPDSTKRYNLTWFHLGADIDNSAPTRGMDPESEAFISSMSDESIFLIVGTIEPRKGHEQALKAFESLWAEGSNAKLVFVGRQGWKVSELCEYFHNHPQNGKKLVWLRSASDEVLEILYQKANCLLCPSRGEGFGLPLIEAARRKLPLIARDIPVFREVAGDNAYYFSGESPESLSQAIRKWLLLYEKGEHPLSDHLKWQTWKDSAKQLLVRIGEMQNDRESL